MKILHLTLKHKFYDMIESGFKPEEYREIKPFWVKRLCIEHLGAMGGDLMNRHKVISYEIRKFTHAHFARGGHFHPSLPQMTWEIREIVVGTGREEWGAELNKDYFVIKLGKKLLT